MSSRFTGALGNVTLVSLISVVGYRLSTASNAKESNQIVPDPANITPILILTLPCGTSSTHDT
ncbi:hypothetical protein AOC36_04450 [Erysipelothrix larvae]|uniref:Uncharacterized protein n=1 Tax=Erysipelothrix larvae TaxID=1514105 RepID=A0A0X8GZF3_9FIRM|nr:hypothetical protein [Erysipelothrix larvae]AMC93247.1 hypothetical protein AOC36_04450 [Erysipelothrix larvae]